MHVGTRAKLLTVLFGICWSISSANPHVGLTTLCIISCVLTAPYFFVLIAGRYAGNAIIALALLVVGLLIPPLWPLVALWAFICLLSKWMLFVSNLPFILFGCALYVLTAYVPTALLEAAAGAFGASGVGVFEALIGIAGMVVFLAGLGFIRALGSNPDRGAAFMLGFAAYLVLFALSFLLPGDAGGGDGGA